MAGEICRCHELSKSVERASHSILEQPYLLAVHEWWFHTAIWEFRAIWSCFRCQSNYTIPRRHSTQWQGLEGEEAKCLSTRETLSGKIYLRFATNPGGRKAHNPIGGQLEEHSMLHDPESWQQHPFWLLIVDPTIRDLCISKEENSRKSGES